MDTADFRNYFRVGIASLAANGHPDHCEDSAMTDPKRGLAAVFDGIGGAAGGEAASSAAKEAFVAAADKLDEIDATDPIARREWLQQALWEAGDAVRAVRTSLSQGTTAAAAILAGEFVLAASIGDSRVYKFNPMGLELLTDDDILENDPQAKAARAEVDQADNIKEIRSPAAQRLFSGRNRLTDEVGTRRQLAVVDGHPADPEDLILVTSDGVHDNLTQKEIERILRENLSSGPQSIAEALCRAARQRSEEAHFRAKDDDITAVIIQAK